LTGKQGWKRLKPSLDVRLEVYEGPLDLLLHLIQTQEIDITDIPISLITEQYLEYLASMEEMNLEIGGEFIVMAATLLSIKARMLLPRPVFQEEAAAIDEDPREELVRLLVEYSKFRNAALQFDQVFKARGILAPRGGKPSIKVIYQLESQDPKNLRQAFREVLESAKTEEVYLPVDWDLSKRIEELMTLIESQGRFIFHKLLSPDRRLVIVSFLAILEILRRGLAHGEQNQAFGPITIDRKVGEAF
jgi:segregation and condensation protein A